MASANGQDDIACLELDPGREFNAYVLTAQGAGCGVRADMARVEGVGVNDAITVVVEECELRSMVWRCEETVCLAVRLFDIRNLSMSSSCSWPACVQEVFSFCSWLVGFLVELPQNLL